MKLKILLFVIMMASFTAGAQEKVFRFGPKAGLNVSDISGSIDVATRLGFHAGMQFNIRLNNHWRLQPEMYFSMQGGRMPDNVIDKQSEKYNYLAFPVLVQYRFTKRFFVEAGPQAGILVNGRMRTYTHTDGSTYDSRHENTFDFLIAAGAGYQFNERFGINVRYNQGITGIRRSANAEKQRSMVLQAGGFMYF